MEEESIHKKFQKGKITYTEYIHALKEIVEKNKDKKYYEL